MFLLDKDLDAASAAVSLQPGAPMFQGTASLYGILLIVVAVGVFLAMYHQSSPPKAGRRVDVASLLVERSRVPELIDGASLCKRKRTQEGWDGQALVND